MELIISSVHIYRMPAHVHIYKQIHTMLSTLSSVKIVSYLFDALELELPCFSFCLLVVSMLWLW